MMTKTYKLVLVAQVWFDKSVTVEADSLEEAHEKAMEIYQDEDVCAEWTCTYMDCDVEESEDE
jgi:hypothetical protein